MKLKALIWTFTTGVLPLLKLILPLVAIAVLMYFGFIADVPAVQYVVQFFVWAICLPVGLYALTERAHKQLLAQEQPKNGRMQFINWGIAGAVLIVFVWQGHIATGLAWGIYVFCSLFSLYRVRRSRERAVESVG